MADLQVRKFAITFPEVEDNIGVGIYQVSPKWWGYVPAQPWSNDEHMHTQTELTLITRGEGDYWINGRRIPVKSGDVVVAFPGEIHRISSPHDSALGMVFLSWDISLNLEKKPPTEDSDARALNRMIALFLSGQERVGSESPGTGIGRMMEAIREILDSRTPGWLDTIHSLSRACLIRTAWLMTSPSTPASPTPPEGAWGLTTIPKTGNAEILLNRAEQYIFNNYREDLKVEHVAKHLGVSIRTLQRLFQQKGFNYRIYSNAVRMGIARFRVMATDRPLKVLARDMGYRSQTQFISFFRRENGVSPASYRKKRMKLPKP